jgi:hypothetical protein
MRDYTELRAAAAAEPKVAVEAGVLLELLDELERLRAKRIAPAERRKRHATPEDEKCARWIYGLILNTSPSAKQPTWSVWADEVRLMRELDKRSHREICELFQWAHADPFWCANILSPKKLREKWDQLAVKRARAAGAQQQGHGKFHFSGADRAGDRAAQHSAMARLGIAVPAGEVAL